MNRSKALLQTLRFHCSETKQEINKENSYIGVDLDGTVAFYDTFKSPDHIGDPIPAMVDKIKEKLKEGTNIKILTARVSPTTSEDPEAARKLIQSWCEKHIGQSLDVTCEKDSNLIELWDDRARQVVKNTGKFIDEVD